MTETVIVIPAFNESARIDKILIQLAKLKFNVVVVDDGSKDKTSETALSAKKRFKKGSLFVLKHKVNLGKGAALKTGCIAAFNLGARYIVILDADGQHKVEDIDKFDLAIHNNFDIVFGSRNLKINSPLVRVAGNKIASMLVHLLFGIKISDLLCGYRAFTKQAFKKINWESTGYGVETEMVVKVGLNHIKYCEVPIETIYYDKYKGVTILDAVGIFFSVIKWRILK